MCLLSAYHQTLLTVLNTYYVFDDTIEINHMVLYLILLRQNILITYKTAHAIQ